MPKARFGVVRLTFPFGWYQVYGGEKSLGIGVAGHDVLLIPQTPNASPHPTNPTWGGGGGEGGSGTCGWGVGWGMREILCKYAYIHTCGYQDYGRKKLGNPKIQARFNHVQ